MNARLNGYGIKPREGVKHDRDYRQPVIVDTFCARYCFLSCAIIAWDFILSVSALACIRLYSVCARLGIKDLIDTTQKPKIIIIK